jgi:hypothetical protein
MSDLEFKKFYDSVKDPAWPDVSDYRQFLELPKDLQAECRDVHGLQTRLDAICDPDYWINETVEVFAKDDLAFVPIPKCAYTYYRHSFYEAGWQRVRLKDIDRQHTRVFGVLKHPRQRYCKGIAQQLVFQFAINDPVAHDTNPWVSRCGPIDWDALDSVLDSKYFTKFLSSITVGDVHSMPYHLMFGKLLHQVTWIPIDYLGSTQTDSFINNFISTHSQIETLNFNQHRSHESDTKKIQLYEKIKSSFFDTPSRFYSFYKIFGPDLKLYYDLLNQFSNQAV